MDFLEIFHRSVSQKELPLRIDDNEGGVGGGGLYLVEQVIFTILPINLS